MKTELISFSFLTLRLFGTLRDLLTYRYFETLGICGNFGILGTKGPGSDMSKFPFSFEIFPT
jgi:hypothetical protein